MIPCIRTVRRAPAFLLAASGLVLLFALAGSATAARQDAVVSWIAPTPPERAVLGVAAHTQLSVPLAATAPGGPAVRIKIRTSGTVPRGSLLHQADGNPAGARFTWTPAAAQVGEYRVTFTATADVPAVGAQRMLVVRVGPRGRPPPGPPPPPGVYPKRELLSDRAHETYKWALVRRRTVARRGPSSSTRVVSSISYRTPELYRNALHVLSSVQYRNGQTWVRVRLAILPNGSTGWVLRRSLTAFRTIHTRLVIDRRALRATLFRFGRPVFRTRVGVGQPQWPTPGGEFYIREKLSGYYSPVYGPRAFGLNARSTKLTDWPGGGFIGIHGTNQPEILPGRVSHGCVRMRNGPVMRLFRLMPLGTPVTIR
jgi:hypothetical protein